MLSFLLGSGSINLTVSGTLGLCLACVWCFPRAASVLFFWVELDLEVLYGTTYMSTTACLDHFTYLSVCEGFEAAEPESGV